MLPGLQINSSQVNLQVNPVRARSLSRPAENIGDPLEAHQSGEHLRNWLPWVLSAVVAFVLLYQLGGAALFEPDEGRNAEKAREILVLNNWVTPHENFYPVLDKPIFFYWLVALSYKVFGVSEWSARIPSFLAGLGCVLLVYRFAQLHWGKWAALWSALVLVSSVEFFILARIVIFDMSLTFFETLALWAFYEAQQDEGSRRRRLALCVIMYLALGAGTLTKGLVGLIIPGMVFFLYILLRRRWHILRRLYLVPGALLFLAVVLPWYFKAEAQNPGYLDYYLWAEHFGRYTTASFDRSEPWYYFILVALVGFFPWTVLLPWIVKHYWNRSWDDQTLFLGLWVCVPFLFFSASNSKLPHYILPLFPALSILTGATLVDLYQRSESKLRFALVFIWLAQSLNALYLLMGSFYPAILARQIRGGVDSMTHLIWVFPACSLLLLGYFALGKIDYGRPGHSIIYLAHALGLSLFLVFLTQLMVLISPDRSAKPIAQAAMAHGPAERQMVFFDTYLAGLPFYLKAERPIWLITYENKKRTFLGNYYAIGNRQEPLTRWGRAIFTFDDFREQWNSFQWPLLVIVKEKNLDLLIRTVGESAQPLAKIDDYVLVSNR